MNNDTIKLLNLEGLNVDLNKSNVCKVNNVLYCNIILTTKDEYCPKCGSVEYTIKDYREKSVSHSISTSSPCIIKYKARRYKCKYCNNSFYEFNPFATSNEKISTFTRLMVIDALRSHTATFTSVAKEYKLTTQSVMNIFDTWVDCKRKTFPSIICIDEIYTNKLSNSSKYSAVLLDFKTRQLVEIYSSRHKAFLANQFTYIPIEERNNVKTIIIDMWDSYRELAYRYFKNSIVAVDSFHVIKYLNDAITKVRLRVMRKFKNPKSMFISRLGYQYLNQKKWKKDEIRKYLLSIDDDLKYAYELKEKYREFNLSAEYDRCDEELDELIYKFTNSHLEEYRIFGKMLRRWKKEIKKRLSNGPMEGTNSRLKCIIKNVNGYRNFNRFRNRCFFAINKNEPILGNPKRKENK